MRLALVIAIYNRHDLESLVIERYKEQSKKYGFEIIIAGSEGEASQKIAKGCHYIEIKNYPVSVKHNALINKAKELDVDGVVLSGSDNIVNDNYWKFIYGLSNKENEIIIIYILNLLAKGDMVSVIRKKLEEITLIYLNFYETDEYDFVINIISSVENNDNEHFVFEIHRFSQIQHLSTFKDLYITIKKRMNI
jgi:hypothetical protein